MAKADYLIAPSILAADFARLGEECDNVLAAGADVIVGTRPISGQLTCCPAGLDIMSAGLTTKE